MSGYLTLDDIAYGEVTPPGGLAGLDDLGKLRLKKKLKKIVKKVVKPIKKVVQIHKKITAPLKAIHKKIGLKAVVSKFRGKSHSKSQVAYQDAPVGEEGTVADPMPPPGYYVEQAAQETAEETGMDPAQAAQQMAYGGGPSYGAPYGAPEGEMIPAEGAEVPVAEEGIELPGAPKPEEKKEGPGAGLLLLLALPAAYFALK